MARTPIHPGEILREELERLGISAAEFARQLNVPTNRITGILNGQRTVRPIPRCASATGSAPARSSG
ncbi:MAG: helix-turn-helix domain-containing protein [Rhizomicrobium sp.]